MYKTTQEPWLTVTDIKQYFYCKAIPYINHILGIHEPTKEYQLQGKEAHQELSKLEKRRKTILKHIKTTKNTTKLFRIKITSHKHKLTGILDCLIINQNKYTPIEYKLTKTQKGKPHPHHKYQLVAYAIIIDDTYNTIVTKGYIYYHQDNKLTKININQTMKNHVIKAINQIRQIITTEKEPLIRPQIPKCIACGYRKHCPWTPI